jgi:hypothetical protein
MVGLTAGLCDSDLGVAGNLLAQLFKHRREV